MMGVQEGFVSLATIITLVPDTNYSFLYLHSLRNSSLMDFGRPNPNQLPTPPETDTDYLMNAPGVADVDINSQPSGAPFRRVSTLAYHNSHFRELRERTTTRQPRWLIVVIPPAWLVQEHGPFGQTLASGPPQRLSQGVLMPLLPTVS